MDFSQYVLLGFVIAGVTELLNRIRAKDYWTTATIITAAIIGGLFGFFNYYPTLDLVEGIAAGFGASGALKAISMVGNKSTPAPSKVLVK